MTVIKMKSCLAMGIAAAFGWAGSVQADIVTLSDENSSAIFHTEASDGGTFGQNNWTVDGVDHLAQRALWFRVGPMTNEASLSELFKVGENAVSTDFDNDNDTLVVRYDNSNGLTPGNFEIDLRYSLLGGSLGSGNASITQMISVKNTGLAVLDFNLFDFANFNLGGDANGDYVASPGGLGNTMGVNDPAANVIAETVATLIPTAFQVGDANALSTSLDDNAITNLNNDAGVFGPGDAGWAYQWSYLIEPGQTVLISSASNIQSIAIPEPSSLTLLAAAALTLMRRRK